MNNDIIDINSIINNDTEEDFSKVDINPAQESNQSLKNILENDETMIGIDRLFDIPNVQTDEEKKIAEFKKLQEIKKDKNIERIQIGLILLLVVVGSLIYFFGYDLFEPFIKID